MASAESVHSSMTRSWRLSTDGDDEDESLNKFHARDWKLRAPPPVEESANEEVVPDCPDSEKSSGARSLTGANGASGLRSPGEESGSLESHPRHVYPVAKCRVRIEQAAHARAREFNLVLEEHWAAGSSP